MSDLDKVLAHIDADFDNALDRLFQTVRLKSISTDPAYAAETRACAEWHAKDLESIGFKAEVRDTPGHPIVLAKNHEAKGTKVLFYGHYDVQPADPLELWEGDPFEPKIATLPDGSKEIRGRGLWIGVELTVAARPYCERLKDLGLLCKETHDHVIRLAPPLVISQEDLAWAVGQLRRAFPAHATGNTNESEDRGE